MQDNQLNFREVAADLRRQWKLLHQKSGVVTRGAFPVFGPSAHKSDQEISQDPDQEQEQETDRRQMQRKGRKAGIPKRKGTETIGQLSGKLCKACLCAYGLSECFYVFEKKAPDGWRPNIGIQRLVQDRLQDNSLAEEVKRLKKGKTLSADS